MRFRNGPKGRPKTVIGWREWLALPELGLNRIKAKIDTGARTSTLHAFSVESFRHDSGAEWVRFGVHPVQGDVDTEVFCEAPVIDRRNVRDSGGHQGERYVIGTRIDIGEMSVHAEVTLTARDDMLFRMLLGRTAMRGLFVVDPAKSFLLSKTKK